MNTHQQRQSLYGVRNHIVSITPEELRAAAQEQIRKGRALSTCAGALEDDDPAALEIAYQQLIAIDPAQLDSEMRTLTQLVQQRLYSLRCHGE